MNADRPPPLPFPLGRLFEPFYRAVVARRNRQFDAGAGVTRLSVPVISVGNLSVGGTGKTPMVMRLIEWLRDAGHTPAIAMRGYRARAGQPSDEESEYRTRFAGIKIVAQPDRLAGLRPILERNEADCVVLDDGFQHRRIARDLDIVLVDATRSPFNDRCLPAGWLREPVESLRRAGLVVLTHAEAAVEATLADRRVQIKKITAAPVCAARHEWSGIRVAAGLGSTDYEAMEPVEWLRGRQVIAACGIGNPDAFVAGLRSAGATTLSTIAARDHHEWNRRDADDLRTRAKAHPGSVVAMTEKDWVKFSRLNVNGLIVARPALRLALGDDEGRVKQIALETAHKRQSNTDLK